MKVLITVPDLQKTGGVSGYFRVSQPHFRGSVEYSVRGSRGGGGPLRLPLRLFRDYSAFMRSLLQGGHQLVHQNTSFGGEGLVRDAVVILITKLLRRRLLVFVHGWDERLEKRMSGVRLALFRAAYFRADAIAVLAGRFEDRLRAWGYQGPIFVETTIVEPSCARAAAEIAPRDPAAPLEVLFMARIERAKGVLTAIEAVRLLQERGVRCRLTIAGSGTAEDEARRAAAEAGIEVVFPGYVGGDEKRALLHRSHLYLFPTTHGEGMPTTVLEAMAAGLPVVTRPVGGVADFFVDGQMGRLTSEVAAEPFAELIEELARDEDARLRMARHNAEYAYARFLAPSVVGRLEAIYDRVLSS